MLIPQGNICGGVSCPLFSVITLLSHTYATCILIEHNFFYLPDILSLVPIDGNVSSVFGCISWAEVSEAWLNELEMELAVLKRFYESHKVILEKVQRRETLWKKLQELQMQTSNPDRFNNRGGCLLREERERKQLCKQIPCVSTHSFAELPVLLTLQSSSTLRYMTLSLFGEAEFFSSKRGKKFLVPTFGVVYHQRVPS